MLTANADHHPLMRRFHKPGDEKRSVLIVPPAQYEEWLSCRNPELARTFFRLPHEDDMAAAAAPLPARMMADSAGLACWRSARLVPDGVAARLTESRGKKADRAEFATCHQLPHEGGRRRAH
jgi:hypothetical protein